MKKRQEKYPRAKMLLQFVLFAILSQDIISWIHGLFRPPALGWCFIVYCGAYSVQSRDEHKYLNIQIFKYFCAQINICIRFHDKVNIQIYSNIRSVL